MCRKPTVASTEIFGAEVGAALQSSNLRGHKGDGQSSWWHHELAMPSCYQC